MVRSANVTQNINDVKVLVDKAMACVQPPYWDKCFGNYIQRPKSKLESQKLIFLSFRSYGERTGTLYEV